MYDTGRYEVVMVSTAGVPNIDMTSTGRTNTWAPQCVPHRVKMISINLNATPGDAGVVAIEKRPTYSSNTSTATVATINLATTHTFTAGSQSRQVYAEVDIVVNVGEELVVNVTDASASVSAARVGLWVEAAYSRPVNSSGMVLTT